MSGPRCGHAAKALDDRAQASGSHPLPAHEGDRAPTDVPSRRGPQPSGIRRAAWGTTSEEGDLQPGRRQLPVGPLQSHVDPALVTVGQGDVMERRTPTGPRSVS
ncbi:hypothetical protein GCM10010392_40860 [Streptomyces clavifer]|nr:hypothetical protein GCM10010392_40860 [Streptomyces clavifer]